MKPQQSPSPAKLFILFGVSFAAVIFLSLCILTIFSGLFAGAL